MDWQGATRIVYDDEEIRVIWHPGQNDFVLITFGDMRATVQGHRYFADKPAQKANIAALGFVAKSPNWYPAKNVRRAFQAISSLIADYPTKIAYGGSMGGYAAVKFSGLFGASHVIAFCPQWSLDPAECDGINPGWQDHLRPDMTGMGIRAADIGGQIFLSIDQRDQLDMFHGGKILEASPDARVINVPWIGHNVTSVFAGTEKLLTLISACRAHDVQALQAFTLRMRRNYPVRRDRLVATAIKRFPRIGYAKLIQHAYKDRGFLSQNPRYLPGALTYSVRAYGETGAMRFYLAFRDLCDPIQQMVLCAQLFRLTRCNILLETAFGTALIYDLTDHRCSHEKSCNSETEYYIGLEIFGRFAALYVFIGEVRLYLARDHRQGISIPPLAAEMRDPFGFVVEPTGNGTFALKNADAYLSAEPGGKIICDRKAASNWERFSFGAQALPAAL